MDAILEILRTFVDSEQSLAYLFVGVAAAVAVVLVLGISFLILGASDPVQRRIGSIGTQREELPSGRMLVSIQTLLGPVAKYVLPKDEIERNSVTRQLVHAGFRSPDALQTYYAIKTLGAVMAPILVLIATQWLPALTTTQITIYTFVAAGIGLLAPSYVLGKLVDARLRKLRVGFPDALDLMVVCVEAGLGMSQAIQRVAEELGVSHPELAEELALVNAEVRAGVDRTTALRNLADRSGLEELNGLVSLLVQTLRFGTSIADSLRVYSEEFRDKRMQRAEEVAATIGTRMIFPLIVFLFPGFFVVAVGPAVLRIMAAFSQM
jgi:tight adherence protein C